MCVFVCVCVCVCVFVCTDRIGRLLSTMQPIKGTVSVFVNLSQRMQMSMQIVFVEQRNMRIREEKEVEKEEEGFHFIIHCSFSMKWTHHKSHTHGRIMYALREKEDFHID